jgi:hypothetical protein
MRVNPQEFISFPRQTVIGFVPASAPLEQVQEALDGTGLAGQEVAFLDGHDGLQILSRGGESATLRQRILRKVELLSEEGLHLSRAIDHLRSGMAVVAIRRVGSHDAPRVRQALETAGVGTHHYFGTRTFD